MFYKYWDSSMNNGSNFASLLLLDIFMKMKKLKYSHLIFFTLLNFLFLLKFREVNIVFIYHYHPDPHCGTEKIF